MNLELSDAMTLPVEITQAKVEAASKGKSHYHLVPNRRSLWDLSRDDRLEINYSSLVISH